MILTERPSPNFNDRKAPPYMVVLHYTGMQDAASALERLCDPDAKVSAHYVVDEDGTVFRLVPEERRAWHAGVSKWEDETDINGASIGIEIVNPGHEFGYRPFSDAQIDAVIALLDDIGTRWQIEKHHLVGHSDVAPDRKEDPGELFPWARLAEAGHGLWAEVTVPDNASMGAPLGLGDEGLGVFSLQAALGKFGYGIRAGGPFDAETQTTVTAFQRHFVPERIGTDLEGKADAKTRMTLMALLRLKVE